LADSEGVVLSFFHRRGAEAQRKIPLSFRRGVRGEVLCVFAVKVFLSKQIKIISD
jgi:hypothetical protein